MKYPAWCRASALAAFALAVSGCRSFDVEDSQFAIIFVPTNPVEGGGFATRPSAFFFEGTGVRLSSTQVGAEGCIVQDVGTPVQQTFDDIDAGAGVSVSIGAADGVLTPSMGGAQVLYELPAGQALPFTPGERITFSIPGAAGGFPARVVSALTVADFTPAPVTLPTSTSANLQVTWTPASPTPGTAMFYSFRYSADGGNLNREIACVFADDGSGTVEASLLSGLRQSEARTIQAQRALTSVDRVGSAITHVTSTLVKSVEFSESQ